MMDRTPDFSIHNLSHCPLSAQCLRFADEIDEPTQVASISDDYYKRDRLLVEQLRAHIPTCLPCTITMKQERHKRERQRGRLRAFLGGGEQLVPSTTVLIMAAIKREIAQERTITDYTFDEELSDRTQLEHPLQPVEPPQQQKERTRFRYRWLYTVLSLTAIILIALFSANFFKISPLPLSPTGNWSSVTMTFVQKSTLTIASYEPVGGKSVVLATSLGLNTIIDGLSHQGDRLLYHVYDGQKTEYILLAPATKQPLYTFSGMGKHAIWSTDDASVFVASDKEIIQIDSRSGAVLQTLPLSQPVNLRFYRDGYLYFALDREGVDGTLHRMNLSNGQQQELTDCAVSKSVSLSLDGKTINFVCADQKKLYAINSDGTNERLLRLDMTMLVGYSADNAPLLLQQNQQKYQLVKLGAEPAQDQILVADVAPGTSVVKADMVLFAPDGRGLIAKGIYTGGSEEIWYTDLVTGKQNKISVSSSEMPIDLLGWDRFQVDSQSSS